VTSFWSIVEIFDNCLTFRHPKTGKGRNFLWKIFRPNKKTLCVKLFEPGNPGPKNGEKTYTGKVLDFRLKPGKRFWGLRFWVYGGGLGVGTP
jgi:hypothetical protein